MRPKRDVGGLVDLFFLLSLVFVDIIKNECQCRCSGKVASRWTAVWWLVAGGCFSLSSLIPYFFFLNDLLVLHLVHVLVFLVLGGGSCVVCCLSDGRWPRADGR